jgi:hypothetical protein
MTKVSFNGEECTVVLSRYLSSENISIHLLAADGSPFATASVNTGRDMNSDRVMIKSYSENVGMFETLLKAGIVELIGLIPAGYTVLHLCRVMPEYLPHDPA